jgi:type IV pilus assembly protein PilV
MTIPRQLGTSLIEVLVTLVILAVGLLGIAALQGKTQVGSIESYQRAQAIILASDMANRLAGNPSGAAAYLSTTIGTGDDRSDDCSALAAGAPLDLCEWSKSLRGTAEKLGSSSTATNIGSMENGRGCIEQIQAADESAGVCKPAIYRISVAWQGLHKTTEPAITCGKTSSTNPYGESGYRRVVSQQVTIGLPGCS